MESIRKRLNVTLPEESERLLVGARLRKRLKEGAICRAKRDLQIAEEWLLLDRSAGAVEAANEKAT